MSYTFCVASDLEKYRAQFFQICGFCFMTPLGKVILGLLDYDLDKIWPKLFAYFIFSLLLAYLGIIFVLKGEEKLYEKPLRKEGYK